MTRSPRLGMLASLALATVATLATGPARAQDVTKSPISGTARLEVGFLPDPHRVPVTAGGSIRTRLGGVPAMVSDAPDFRLHYTAGEVPLSFKVEAQGATTILVNTPDGKWIAAGGPNPVLKIDTPLSGQYDVWVGNPQQGFLPAVLIVTER